MRDGRPGKKKEDDQTREATNVYSLVACISNDGNSSISQILTSYEQGNPAFLTKS